MALGTAVYAGPIAATMAELFPAASRSTGLALSYSVGVALFGELALLLTAALIGLTGSDLAHGLYIAFAAAVSLLAVAGARRLGLR